MSEVVGIIIGGLIGVITTYAFTTRSKLYYQVSKLQIIGNIGLNLPDEFEVTVAGKRINNLQKSQIIIWNGGTSTIMGDKIVKEDHLRLVFDASTNILDVNITGLSRKVTKFTAEKDMTRENEVILEFDFLDRKDGVIIEILHTNSNSDVKLDGTIRGLRKGIKFKGYIDYFNTSKKIVSGRRFW